MPNLPERTQRALSRGGRYRTRSIVLSTKSEKLLFFLFDVTDPKMDEMCSSRAVLGVASLVLVGYWTMRAQQLPNFEMNGQELNIFQASAEFWCSESYVLSCALALCSGIWPYFSLAWTCRSLLFTPKKDGSLLMRLNRMMFFDVYLVAIASATSPGAFAPRHGLFSLFSACATIQLLALYSHRDGKLSSSSRINKQDRAMLVFVLFAATFAIVFVLCAPKAPHIAKTIDRAWNVRSIAENAGSTRRHVVTTALALPTFRIALRLVSVAFEPLDEILRLFSAFSAADLFLVTLGFVAFDLTTVNLVLKNYVCALLIVLGEAFILLVLEDVDALKADPAEVIPLLEVKKDVEAPSSSTFEDVDLQETSV